MIAWALLLSLIAVVVTYRLSLRPKRLESGEWRVVDHSDGPLNTFVACFALFVGTQYALRIGYGMAEGLTQKPGEAALGLLLVVIAYGALLWWQGRRVYEATYAAPGQLIVANWPLAAGEFVEVTYKRRLRRGIPAGDVKAKLVHYEVTHRHDSNGRHGAKRTTRLVEVRLEDGEASFQDKELVATWRFQVPNAMGNPIESLQRSFVDLLSNRHRDDEWWALEVEMPLQTGNMLDSSFKLDISYIEGRTRFHLGA